MILTGKRQVKSIMDKLKLADYWIVAGKFVPRTRRYGYFYVRAEIEIKEDGNSVLDNVQCLSREELIDLIENGYLVCIGGYEKRKNAYAFNGYVRVYYSKFKKKKILYLTPQHVLYDVLGILPWKIEDEWDTVT